MERSPYRPLIVLTLVSAAAAYALAPLTHAFMSVFMGLALVAFAMLKLFTPDKFADGFAKYDLLGKHWRPYGYIYPYIELTLGLLYLARLSPVICGVISITVFGFGAVGVLIALRKGLNVNCACMGNVLSVPLSTVTLGEDFAMIAMALMMMAV